MLNYPETEDLGIPKAKYSHSVCKSSLSFSSTAQSIDPHYRLLLFNFQMDGGFELFKHNADNGNQKRGSPPCKTLPVLFNMISFQATRRHLPFISRSSLRGTAAFSACFRCSEIGLKDRLQEIPIGQTTGAAEAQSALCPRREQPPGRT